MRTGRAATVFTVYEVGTFAMDWVPPSSSRDTERTMSQENLEVVRRWWASFNDEGMPSLDLCDEQVEVRNPPAFPVRGSYHGHEGVRQWRADVFDVIDEGRPATCPFAEARVMRI